MIKLKSLLTEHKNGYSWLAPNGTFYPTGNHEHMAHMILLKLDLPPEERDKIENDPYDLMYKRGFLRVVNLHNYNTNLKDIYTSNRYHRPTNAQIRALTDLAIDGGYGKVVFAKDDKDHFTIWDKDHQLE